MRSINLHRVGFAVVCSVLLSGAPALFAQDQPPPQDQSQQQDRPDYSNQQDRQGSPDQQDPGDQQAPKLPPQQLDSLVAPIALYPDSLLGQLLVATTYPLEVVELSQWLTQNRGLQGVELMDAAKQQNWDPSVQALVAFPDVIKKLTSDVRWTTDLGNAFLSQQGDVMDAVQRMRSKAQSAGKLQTTPQQVVREEQQESRRVIEIQPADPEVVYVPTYDPSYIWGAPAYPYPALYYPSPYVTAGFLGFGAGIHWGGWFGGYGGWGGWGWGPSWYNRTIIVNNNFFHRYRFNDYHSGGGWRGNGVWAHNPDHRLGVPYADRGIANRFNGGAYNRGGYTGSRAPERFNGNGNGNFNRPSGATRPSFPSGGQYRGSQAGNTRPESPRNPGGSSNNPGGAYNGGNHSAFGGVNEGNRSRMESDHGYSSMGRQQPTYRQPQQQQQPQQQPQRQQQRQSAPQQAPRMSAPRQSAAPQQHNSAPRPSGGERRR